MLSDKHPGVAVHFQSNFQGLLHPVESGPSVSLWAREQLYGKQALSVAGCLGPSGEASSTYKHLVQVE